MIEWTQDLATGIEAVDAQHRELYGAVAQLHGAMRNRRLHEIPGILSFLARHAREHFALEEQVMERAGYPALDAHRAAHRSFFAEYLRMRDALSSPPAPSAVLDLSSWLGAWLREHVRRMDGEMARFMTPHLAESDRARPPAR